MALPKPSFLLALPFTIGIVHLLLLLLVGWLAFGTSKSGKAKKKEAKKKSPPTNGF
jgi:hypothetical protein